MNYNEYIANIKAYRNGTLMQAAPTDALSDWHEKYFDTAVSALSKKMIADHVEHSEDADKFGKDFVSLVAMLEEDGVSKQDIGKELEAVSKAAQSQADAAIKKLDSVQHSTDTFEGYQAAIDAYKESHLEHGEWKKHKYIRIENGRYIYPDVREKSISSGANQYLRNDIAMDDKMMETHAKAAGTYAGDKSKVSEKNLEAAAEKARMEAAKGYANDLTDAIVENASYWLKGFDALINIDDTLQKYIDEKGVEITKEGYKEVQKMAITQAVRKIDAEIEENSKREKPVNYDPERLKTWKEEKGKLLEAAGSNRPFANRSEEIKNLEDKQKIQHSDPRSAFYAAIDAYKAQHGTQLVPL